MKNLKILKPNDTLTMPLVIITLIGISVLSFRLLVWGDVSHTGLLYIGLPFFLSLILYRFTPDTDKTTWRRRFWKNLRSGLVIMLAVSIFLMEGYVCVLMFLPIYLLANLLAFIGYYLFNRSKKGAIHVYIIPVAVILLSLEGVSTATTFDRYNEVTYSHIIQADVPTIKRRLSQPINLSNQRHWMLSIFPLPEEIRAGSLNQGDVHTLDFVYHRWFSTNTHKGNMSVTLSEVTDSYIKTSIDDKSYISTYLDLHGTILTFQPISDTETNVTLTISFDRLLDPVWYFEPLERFAVKKSAEFLINEILSKDV